MLKSLVLCLKHDLIDDYLNAFDRQFKKNVRDFSGLRGVPETCPFIDEIVLLLILFKRIS